MSEFKTIYDHLGREISYSYPPKRIISTVPSISETLGDLNLELEVLGVTRFCVHPSHWKKEKTIIGGTKRLDFTRISNLNPDLLIGIKEENVKPQVDEIAAKFPYWIGDVNSFNDNYRLISDLGALCNREDEAESILKNTKKVIESLKNGLKRKAKVLYFIWRGPYMLAGNNTYINSFLEELGFENAAKKLHGRYPKTDVEQIKLLDFDFILLSSEPFPFNQLHAQELKVNFPDKTILFVDGEIFSYYGSRVSKEKEYLSAFISEVNKY